MRWNPRVRSISSAPREWRRAPSAPADKGWKFEGALEKLMHKINMFARKSAYSMDGFEGSGADFMPEYKPYILDGRSPQGRGLRRPS